MDTMDCIVLMYDSKRHVGGVTDILDRGSIPLISTQGDAMASTGYTEHD